ncbi:hypothetical protein DR046_12580 [Jannaschia formosa]|nr:hypothetical protein DR046_12580 [Jannaschia formosa]
MVGRGTRLCPDLFGPGMRKTEFRIFDVCGKLEFFGANPELSDPPVPKSLTERLIAARLKLTQAIDQAVATGSPPQTILPVAQNEAVSREELAEVRTGMVGEVRPFISGLDTSSFSVRSHLRLVDAWQAEDAPWSQLSDDAAEELAHLASLPSSTDLGGEEAKRFDLLMFEVQLSLFGRSTKLEACRRRVTEIATALSTKMEIPAIARHAELIEDLMSEVWWTGLTVPVVERARLRLRDLVHLIDQVSRPVLYTDFLDELGVPTTVALSPTADFAASKKKARAFLAEHEDHVTLRRLRSGKALTALDISELERMLLAAGVGSDADIGAARTMEAAQVVGFGVFLRSLVGLDRGASQEYFAAFIADGASADQIEFIAMVIEYLAESGVIDPGLLYTSPFTDTSPNGPDDLFEAAVVEDLFERLRAINQSAVAIAGANASAEAG